jgi:radical SAM domain protein
MNIGILAVDSNFPNLALMKISAYHKARGDQVEWYNPLCEYEKVYAAKVFTFTPDYNYYINANQIEKGGTGYDIAKMLLPEIDRMQPDYNLYPQIDTRTAYGFLTRGCPNRCKWCVVPKKEGKIAPYMDIEEIAIDGRKNIILMDNNVLASDYGLEQIEKIIKLKLRVDFNQGLDARLVTDNIAQLLAQVKWIKRIRFGCDTPGQIAECERATALIDKYGYKGEYFFYCILMDDFKEAFNRINHWRQKGHRFLPHAQPYRDLNDPRQIIPQWQNDLAGWADKKWIFRSCEFKDFTPRKGFVCSEYFKIN